MDKINRRLTGCYDDCDHIFKIVIIGDSGVGKTNIITRYTRNEFDLSLKSTIGVEFSTKKVNINDKIIKIQFWDTAGQERYRAITSSYYRGVHGIVLVFDISNYASFENINNWINEINSNCELNIPILLIGNKLDLEIKRQVPKEKAIELSNKYNFIFIETSALSGENIQISIDELINKIYSMHGEKKINNQIENKTTNSDENKTINLNKSSNNPINNPKKELNCC